MARQSLANAARICRYTASGEGGVGLTDAIGSVWRLPEPTVTGALRNALTGGTNAAGPVADPRLLAPIDRHEVWGAGVTYSRSRDARVEEAAPAARDCYADVYEAERAELFFKATADRVVGPGASVVVRRDSKATVPEPELALWLDSDLSVLGFGLANDMTARDLEAENPLYLPQAKIWQGSCALGPWVVACDDLDAIQDLALTLEIRRGRRSIFDGHVSLTALRRSPAELIEQLGRDNAFPHGVILLTGTGIVPPDNINLRGGDCVRITGTYLGELHNHAKLGTGRRGPG